MSTDFEARLAESLRYGAELTRAEEAERVAEAVLRTADPMRVVHQRRQPRGALVMAAVLAALVVTAPAVLLTRDRAVPVTGSLPAGSGGPGGGSGGGSGGTGTASPPVIPWQLTGGLYADYAATQPRGREATIEPGGWLYLVVGVSPGHPDGKTYLQVWRSGAWVQLGPHNTDQDSRVGYRLRAPAGGEYATYRVYVPAGPTHAAAYSPQVIVHGQPTATGSG
jgi:hypothetical protein